MEPKRTDPRNVGRDDSGRCERPATTAEGAADDIELLSLPKVGGPTPLWTTVVLDKLFEEFFADERHRCSAYRPPRRDLTEVVSFFRAALAGRAETVAGLDAYRLLEPLGDAHDIDDDGRHDRAEMHGFLSEVRSAEFAAKLCAMGVEHDEIARVQRKATAQELLFYLQEAPGVMWAAFKNAVVAAKAGPKDESQK